MSDLRADWLTTHFPKRPGDPERFDVYLQHHHKDAASGIAIGDRVWFYEFGTAKRTKCEEGSAPRGRLGVVHFARVTGQIYERDRKIAYADGTAADWRWGVPTDVGESGGYVERAKLCEILGYKPGYAFRGFAGGSGLKRLDEGHAALLMTAFRVGTPPFRVPPVR